MPLCNGDTQNIEWRHEPRDPCAYVLTGISSSQAYRLSKSAVSMLTVAVLFLPSRALRSKGSFYFSLPGITVKKAEKILEVCLLIICALYLQYTTS